MKYSVAVLFIWGVSSILFLSSCGNKSNKSGSADDYSYDMTYNGCTTGHHQFTTLEEMCSGLQDENFNNVCAYEQRAVFFKRKNCPGPFKSSSRSYTFSGPGCATGRHGFKNTQEMCRALQSEKLNNNCAVALRESYFKQQCKGKFKITKVSPSFRAEVLKNTDCAGFVITESGPSRGALVGLGWSARDLQSNLFPEIPNHSSILLGCSGAP